ncbi:MAG: hypothetical protein JWR80_5766 [Bradyrhizobium sp.]|nr:hypothetical protein [Bradyrhizobium sp.]
MTGQSHAGRAHGNVNDVAPKRRMRAADSEHDALNGLVVVPWSSPF